MIFYPFSMWLPFQWIRSFFFLLPFSFFLYNYRCSNMEARMTYRKIMFGNYFSAESNDPCKRSSSIPVIFHQIPKEWLWKKRSIEVDDSIYIVRLLNSHIISTPTHCIALHTMFSPFSAPDECRDVDVDKIALEAMQNATWMSINRSWTLCASRHRERSPLSPPSYYMHHVYTLSPSANVRPGPVERIK